MRTPSVSELAPVLVRELSNVPIVQHGGEPLSGPAVLPRRVALRRARRQRHLYGLLGVILLAGVLVATVLTLGVVR